MKIIEFFKNKKNKIMNTLYLLKSYYCDFKEYSHYQYNNPNVKTFNAFEAKILRQSHVIEKGMSLSHPKEKFGVQKAMELLDYIDEFSSYGYKIEDSASVLNAVGVLKAYLSYHEKHGFQPKDVIKRYMKYDKYALQNESYGVIEVKKDDLLNKMNGSFPEFFESRHSIRQFSDIAVNETDIRNAVQLAMKAPSACNRQSCKAYFYRKKDVNMELGKLIAGNTGFGEEVQNYIVLTSDISAFYDPFERNQIYVDGGIFAMALIEAFHYYGIASCILQNGEYRKKNKQFKAICKNIPENEKIILFIAIGYYKDKFTYAISHRKNLNDVFIIE